MLRCLGFSIGLNMRKQTKCSSSRIGNSCLPDRTGKIRSKARWLKCYIIYSPHVDTLISQVATLPRQWSFNTPCAYKAFLRWSLIMCPGQRRKMTKGIFQLRRDRDISFSECESLRPPGFPLRRGLSPRNSAEEFSICKTLSQRTRPWRIAPYSTCVKWNEPP